MKQIKFGGAVRTGKCGAQASLSKQKPIMAAFNPIRRARRSMNVSRALVTVDGKPLEGAAKSQFSVKALSLTQKKKAALRRLLNSGLVGSIRPNEAQPSTCGGRP
jgi:hypothetical protein